MVCSFVVFSFDFYVNRRPDARNAVLVHGHSFKIAVNPQPDQT